MTTSKRHVYVSAGSRGVGLAIAERFARQGYAVAISSRSMERLREAKRILEVKIPGADIHLFQGNLSTEDGQSAILDAMEDEEFWPDVFICGAGQPADTRLESLRREDWNHDAEMILGQAIFATQRFVPVMANNGYGRVIFLSSTHAKTPGNSFFAGTVARAGLFALSKAITDEYAGQGVASFTIGLGYVDTPLLRNMAQGMPWEASRKPDESSEGTWQQKYREWEQTIPAGRIGSPEELANIVHFLAMPEAGYLNGSVLSFSGGLDKVLI